MISENRILKYVRSISRLISILVITQHQVIKLFLEKSLSGNSPALSSRHAGKWASRLSRAVGIQIEMTGELPKVPVLLVSNHRSYIDIIAILSQLPCSFLAKAELLKWPVFGSAAKHGGTIFVDRDNPDSRFSSRDQIAGRIKEGVSVVVFPEGTTFEGPGLLEFRSGVFKVASERSIPVIPVMIFYEDPASAWTGSATFVPHFLTVFGNKTLKIRLSIGPILRGNIPERLQQNAYHWIEQELSTVEFMN